MIPNNTYQSKVDQSPTYITTFPPLLAACHHTPVHAIAHGVGLHKSADVWIMVPGTVIVKTCFKIESPAGEHIRIGMVGVFSGNPAIDAVLVALDGITVRIT